MTPVMNTDIEVSVLGGMIQDATTLTLGLAKLREDDFYNLVNRQVFDVLKSLSDKGKKLDDRLIEHEYFKENGENFLLQNYHHGAATYPDNIETHAFILRNFANKRRLATEIAKITSDFYDPKILSTQHIAKLEQIIAGNMETHQIPGLTPSQIEARDRDKPAYEKLILGDSYLDNEYYQNMGLHKGTTKIVLAHSKHGKTRYCMWEAAQLTEHYKGLYFTYEARDSMVAHAMKQNSKNPENLIIADSQYDIGEIDQTISTIKYWKIKEDIQFAYVDYIQALEVEGIKEEYERIIIKNISKRLTQLANRLNIYICLAAQPPNMNKMKSGWKHFPSVSDLHGSSQLKKDAFMVVSLFRPGQLEELRNYDHEGKVKSIKMKDEADSADRNSVFLQQQITREGEADYTYLHFIDTDKGLKRAHEIYEERKAYYEGSPF